jgi:phosphatidylinositol alpha-1,6-mannosyltransferase
MARKVSWASGDRGPDSNDRRTKGMTPSRRDLILVTAGLELDGGGRASFARLLGRACADYSRSRGIFFRVLSLRGSFPIADGIPIRTFRGRKAGLALAVWRAQLPRRRPALIFDLLGLARTQAMVPVTRRSPYLIVLLGTEVWRELRRAERRAVGGAAACVAISFATRQAALPFLPLREDEIGVMHLALEQRTPEGPRDDELLARAGTGFLFIAGRLAPGDRYKGHDQIVDAFPELLRACPDARLVVAGGGEDRQRLEARARDAGLGHHVLFTGFVSEASLEELYRRCAAFVMPSRGEGFGLVYLEAMRAGKPCVAATGTAAAEVIVDGVTGFLVDPEDPGQLADVLARLLGEPEHARRLGEAGRARWREVFSFERFRDGVFDHLDRLTGLSDVRN